MCDPLFFVDLAMATRCREKLWNEGWWRRWESLELFGDGRGGVTSTKPRHLGTYSLMHPLILSQTRRYGFPFVLGSPASRPSSADDAGLLFLLDRKVRVLGISVGGWVLAEGRGGLWRLTGEGGRSLCFFLCLWGLAKGLRAFLFFP